MLDEKDRIIYEHLLVNARIANKQLARHLDCSEATIFKRIKRLEQQQYITRYDALINWQAIPLQKKVYFLGTQHNNKKLIDALLKNLSVSSIFRTEGAGNLQLWCFYRTQKQLQRVESLIRPFVQADAEIVELFFPDSTFFDIPNRPIPPSPGTTPLTWSKTDVAIMKHLAQGHGRDSLYEISRALKIPYDTAHYHGKKIFQSSAIGRILAQQGFVKFGLVNTALILQLKSQKAVQVVLTASQHAKRVSAIGRCSNNKVLILTTTATQQEFLQTLGSILGNSHSEIISTQQAQWTETVLNNRYPLEELLKIKRKQPPPKDGRQNNTRSN